jgi:hypothetical protein
MRHASAAHLLSFSRKPPFASCLLHFSHLRHVLCHTCSQAFTSSAVRKEGERG